MATRQEAARKRRRHPATGRFVEQQVDQRPNGHTREASLPTPIGISPALMRVLRPQAAFRWILPNIAAITPQYIEMVMRGALAGNHVQQWELFDLMMDTWPELSSCYQELCYGVLSRKIVFEPFHEEDEAPEPEAIERTKLVSTALRNMSPAADRDENALGGTLKDILDGWLRGICVLETLWGPIEDDDFGTIMAPLSTFWVHPVAYGFNQDGMLGLRTVGNNYTQRDGIAYPGGIMPGGGRRPASNVPPITTYPYSNAIAQPQPAVLEPFPPHKFLIGIHKSKSGTALGGPLLRPLCWWWIASNFASDWLLNLAQLFGIPFRYSTYDPNAPRETIDALTQMLQNMGNAGWAAFPSGTTMSFMETGGGRQAEYSPQGTLMDRADRYARLLVLGQTMTGTTMTGGKGGQAFGIVEKDVKQERIEAAGEYACSVINKQLIESILMLNYGDKQWAPSVRLLEENEGQFVDAQRDQILKNIGLPLGADFMRRKYAIPEPAEGEEILGQEVPQPPGTETPEIIEQPPEMGEDGLPQQLNESQPGMAKGDKANA